jgi:NADH-quinone oxidoreductase subunit M
MINHGLSTGALFLLVGVIYERRHTRDMAQFGGLWKVMPLYGVFMLIVALSSMGLPGLNGFVGEFAILLGAWGAGQPGGPLGSYWYAALAAIGVILAAVYLLWMFQRMFLGEITNEKNRNLPDLNRREIAILVPLIIVIFWIGLYPAPFLNLLSPSVDALAATLQAAAVAVR